LQNIIMSQTFPRNPDSNKNASSYFSNDDDYIAQTRANRDDFLPKAERSQIITVNSTSKLQQPTDMEMQWSYLLTDFNQCLRQCSNQLSAFEFTVKETRKLLNCDRVVVYSLNEQAYGVVVAESVAPGWTQALGKVIHDPCFEVRYLEKYRNGRVKALDNIYEAGMTPCYIEQLEALEVKANLVAPILKEGKLFGLLVAHQCNAPRAWQQSETRAIAQIATQVGYQLDQIKLLADYHNLQQQAEREKQWTNYFTDAIQYIRASLNRDDILKATVREVRRVLNCDRVVIYSMDRQDRGVVVAESVAPGWTRALGKVINDPCFEAKYIEKYRNGRVRALENIYAAGMTPCYIEQLENLEVKANLVAPVINEGKLFGLLVAHQCDAPRAWQHYEVRWVAQLATQVGFALDNASVLVNSDRLQQKSQSETQWSQYFTDAIQNIRASLDREDILEVTTEEVRSVLKCDRVVVYSMNRQSHGVIVAESVAPGWTRAKGITIKDPCFESRYMDKYRDGRVRALDNIYEAGMTSCYIEQLEALQVKANLVTPIISEGKLFGLLVAHQCTAPRAWQQPEIMWVAQVATQVGFALDNASLLVNSKHLQQQADNEAQWTQYFTDAIQNIRASLDRDDILDVTTEEVRRILNCDRVVVYSLDRQSYGAIVAESVAPGWTRGLGKVIQDPCFEARYMDKYRNGRVKAQDNIYEAGMTPCYIEQLEVLEVKANLVAPIIGEGKLEGLLVVHQCSAPRVWQQSEIRWIAQLSTQVGFALDNAGLLKRLEHYQNNEIIVRDRDREQERVQTQVSTLLTNSRIAFENLSLGAVSQSSAIAKTLSQIQGIANFAREVVDCTQKVKIQVQLAERTLQSGGHILGQATDSITDTQKEIVQAVVKVNNLTQTSQELSEKLELIENIVKQLTDRSLNVLTSQTENVEREQALEFTEGAISLMQQLSKVTADMKTVFATLEIDADEATDLMSSGAQNVSTGVELVQQTQQKFKQIETSNNRIKVLAEKIYQAIGNQVQTSNFVSQSVQEVASLTQHISKQSLTVIDSFDQLKEFAQKL
jgi:methyl-accepting chemotaxis protein PixJ